MKKSTTKHALTSPNVSAPPKATSPTATSFTAPTADMLAGARFNVLVSTAELTGVYLLRCNSDLHPERYPAEGELALHMDAPQVRAQSLAESHALSCGVRFALWLEPNNGQASGPDAAVVAVSAEYDLAYELPAGATVEPEAALVAFASRLAVFNAWPFFRELAHSLVARMGIPPLVLPLFRLPPSPPVGAQG
jgi:hypothetical protein